MRKKEKREKIVKEMRVRNRHKRIRDERELMTREMRGK